MASIAITQIWRDVHEQFDPIVPVIDARLRVERPAICNPLLHLEKRLRLPIAPMCYAVAGSVGSGKSTELLAASNNLTSDALVVFVDLWRHFESSVRDPGALDHLQPWELLGLLGLAVVRAGTDRFGHHWSKAREEMAEALASFRDESNGVTLDVSKLASGIAVVAGGAAAGAPGATAGAAAAAVAGTTLKLLGAAADATTWNWRVGLRGRKRTSDQEPQVRRVLEATKAVIRELAAAYDRKLVVVVDGLDRIRLADTFEDLFVESSLLRDLSCDIVICLELGLVQRYRSKLRLDRTFEVTNITVVDKSNPMRNGPSISFFDQLVRKRLSVISGAHQKLLPPKAIRRLAWSSGGRLRDFMSLIREVAIQGLIDEFTETPESVIEAVVDQLRREREGGLNADEIEVLQELLADPARRLPGGDTALGLLEKHLLLAYPNESTWYLPHPVLMLNLLERPSPPAG